MRKLDQWSRIIATGFCFTVFGLGGLLLSFIVIPIIQLTSPKSMHREYRVQAVIQLSFHGFCRLMKYTRAIDYKISGADILKQDRNCLVVANHPSLIDYVLIASQLKRCDCLVKASLWSNPFIKHIVKAAGYIPNKAPDDLLDICEQRFEQGNVLLLFPEGTRTTPGVESKIQRGAAQIAVRTGRDLRIVHISVSQSFLTKQAKWYQVPEKRPFFHIEVKDKVEVAPIIKQTTSSTIAARRVQQHLTSRLFPQ
ncbi:lysophospholipid acyltransferase family protein [Vibrio gallicus]|uniref:lysophospholipid acyltransferase family protein n=1 Tax=Vibrio gallicus TaxID=190897 RepID=UPI0021C40E5C|nr:lysophospholipid acyltransferase family protein [Vibrio gallicus]